MPLLYFYKSCIVMLRKLLKGFLYLILTVISIVFILLLLDGINKYPTPPPPSRLLLRKPTKQLLPSNNQATFNDLKKKFGQNKELPKGYERQALLALSYYPELEKVPIKFEITETLIPLASRPDIWSVLLPWKERIYCVIISSKSMEELEPILLHNLSFNAQVGVLGHELGHTVYYLDKTSIQHLGIAIQYMTSSFRKEFERDTDQRTIEHGLGYQLHSWSKEVNEAFKGDTNESTMDSTYYSPSEIKDAIKQLRLYK